MCICMHHIFINTNRGDTDGVCHSPQSKAEFRENSADGAYNTGYEENINSSAWTEDDRSNGGRVEFFYSRRRSTCSRRTASTLRTSETSATPSELLMQSHLFDRRRYCAVATEINDEDSSLESEEGFDDNIATDDALLLHRCFEAPQDTNGNQIQIMSKSCNNLQNDIMMSNKDSLIVEWGALYFPLLRLK